MTKKENFGFAAAPEFTRKNGRLELRDGVRVGFTRCFTCNNMCGLRYRVDEATNTITRLAGNPYCEVVTGGSPLPLETPVAKAYEMLSGEQGLKNRATSCGKGASGLNSATDPRRVTTVLKRAGKRGENKWKTIPYEQALKEIVEGGDLFGEGHVDGLKAIRDLKSEVVPGFPEYGTKANQLFATFNEEDTLRGGFYRRFMNQGFGTINLCTKHAYCGAGVGIGYSLGFSPDISAAMCDVDWNSFEYAVFLGTAPGSSGASINRLGRAVADARVERGVKYVCVDPVLRNDVANNTNAEWQPILPGTDSAFLYGLVRIMLEKGWFNKSFLANPNEEAAKKAGELNWTNAAYLVDVEAGALADAADFGVGEKGEGVVLNKGKLESAAKAAVGDIFAAGKFKRADGRTVELASSLELVRREAVRTSLEDYSKRCGVSVKRMEAIARDFTSHGRRVVAVSNTGCNNSDAVMVGWLICILNTLVGSHDAKGGALYGNFAFFGFEGAYDLAGVEGAAEQSATMNACRNGAYEDSTEYKNKVAAGRNPYPASAVYHNMNPGYIAGNAMEMLLAHVNADPYKAKAFINWRSNPVYSASSFDARAEAALADPKNLPLFIGIDSYINETNRFADYIIPDRVMYEEYACDRTWGNYDQCVVAGVPVLEPRTVVNKKGRHVCMEEFLLDVALEMKLPGFGRGAIARKDGKKVDLMSFDDWHARYLSNVAEQLPNLPKVTDEDRRFAGLERAMKFFEGRLTSEEAGRVEALLSRGGYYDHQDRYNGEFMANGGGKFLQFFNPSMAQLRHCFTGERYPGVPVCREARFFNGEAWSKHWTSKEYPLVFTSFKPILRSNYSAAFDRCVEVSPTNFVFLNGITARQYGVKDGEKVRIVSANGKPAEGVARVDDGVMPGAVVVPHCYGHWAYGSEDREVDGRKVAGIKARGRGTAVNQMIPHDPTRPGAVASLNDFYAGGNCRTGIPVRVEKI